MGAPLPVDYKKGLPAVSTAALGRVQDPAVRDVLSALVDGWNMRNANSGEGGRRFVTAAEIDRITGNVDGFKQQFSNYLQAQNNASKADRGLTPGEINRIINDLQAQVIASRLFVELGERITLIELTNVAQGNTISQEIINRVNADNAIYQSIDTQVTNINGNIAALQTATTTIANNVSALSSTVTTVQAQTGNNTTAIQTEATARANADGQINSKYSVKLDTNGYVSGFGLISTANNANPTSAFYIRADRFAIASPSQPNFEGGIVPFIVNTTTDSAGNPPGVYMDRTIIKRADISEAYIGDLAVSRLKIQNEAVSLVTTNYINSPTTNNSVDTVTTNFITSMPAPGTLTIIAYARPYGTFGAAASSRFTMSLQGFPGVQWIEPSPGYEGQTAAAIVRPLSFTATIAAAAGVLTIPLKWEFSDIGLHGASGAKGADYQILVIRRFK